MPEPFPLTSPLPNFEGVLVPPMTPNAGVPLFPPPPLPPRLIVELPLPLPFPFHEGLPLPLSGLELEVGNLSPGGCDMARDLGAWYGNVVVVNVVDRIGDGRKVGALGLGDDEGSGGV